LPFVKNGAGVVKLVLVMLHEDISLFITMFKANKMHESADEFHDERENIEDGSKMSYVFHVPVFADIK
jgi:hypothetical protein